MENCGLELLTREQILEKTSEKTLKNIIEIFYEALDYLKAQNVSNTTERCQVGIIQNYLHDKITDYDVDVEYNLYGYKVKTISGSYMGEKINK